MQHFLRAHRVAGAVDTGTDPFQKTLAVTAEVCGVGVHSGSPVHMKIHPAPANHGIVFQATNEQGVTTDIPANFALVSDVNLCTVLSDKDTGTSVSTVEHLMAALSALGIDNALIELDGDEVPILDGSSIQFMDAITEAGIVRHRQELRRFIKVIKPVRIEVGDAWAELTPYDDGFRLDVEIDFDNPVIGRQRFVHEHGTETFLDELASARTFGFMKDVEMLWKHGKALGSSLDNTVAVSEEGVVNPGGLRFVDEFVRHKTLDAVGDLALAGMPLLAQFSSYKGGHKVNLKMLEMLFKTPEAFTIVEAQAPAAPRSNIREISSASIISLS